MNINYGEQLKYKNKEANQRFGKRAQDSILMIVSEILNQIHQTDGEYTKMVARWRKRSVKPLKRWSTLGMT